MKKLQKITVPLFLFLVSVSSMALGQKKLKVFISVDMEGISGVVDWTDTRGSDGDYQYFRKVMTKETNAAIEGALEAGATEVIVRDSHGSARNILPEELNPEAKLLRGWVGGPLGMMDGIDETFDAVIFIGYHAKPGTPNAVLEHTVSSTDITDVKINGISCPESGCNGMTAGYFKVPVVFLSGDQAACDQVKAILGNIETLAVKKGIGAAALNLHPEKSRELIKEGVKKALGRLGDFKPFELTGPYKIEVTYKNEEKAYKAALWPGATRTGDWTATYTSNQFLDIMKFLELNY